MEEAVQTYLADLEELTMEVDAILFTSQDAPISNHVKSELKNKFMPVTERMKPLHEYANEFPDFYLWGACNTAHERLGVKMEALFKHNKHVRI
jgi:hypothetical protein